MSQDEIYSADNLIELAPPPPPINKNDLDNDGGNVGGGGRSSIQFYFINPLSSIVLKSTDAVLLQALQLPQASFLSSRSSIRTLAEEQLEAQLLTFLPSPTIFPVSPNTLLTTLLMTTQTEET